MAKPHPDRSILREDDDWLRSPDAEREFILHLEWQIRMSVLGLYVLHEHRTGKLLMNLMVHFAIVNLVLPKHFNRIKNIKRQGDRN